MMTFLAPEDIFDATGDDVVPLHMNTSLMLPSTGVGWGGVGMMTFLAPEDIFDATEMMSFLAHEHIFDATEMMSFLCKRIQVLAAAALHRKPGIMSVLNALQLYRNDCSSGKICVAPKDAFDPDSLSWLA